MLARSLKHFVRNHGALVQKRHQKSPVSALNGKNQRIFLNSLLSSNKFQKRLGSPVTLCKRKLPREIVAILNKQLGMSKLSLLNTVLQKIDSILCDRASAQVLAQSDEILNDNSIHFAPQVVIAILIVETRRCAVLDKRHRTLFVILRVIPGVAFKILDVVASKRNGHSNF
jgi:hypothetical protein